MKFKPFLMLNVQSSQDGAVWLHNDDLLLVIEAKQPAQRPAHPDGHGADVLVRLRVVGFRACNCWGCCISQGWNVAAEPCGHARWHGMWIQLRGTEARLGGNSD